VNTDPNALVAMTHPKVHTSAGVEPASATQAAYEQTWKGLGWRIVGAIDGTGSIVSVTTTQKEK
jgi:hypothetical protein